MEGIDQFTEKPDQEEPEKLNEVEESTLIATVKSRFEEASLARRPHEDRMINAYNNFRGLYGKHVPFRKSERSNIFVKATKTKVLAGYGQIIDIAFGGEKFPLGIEPTDVPEGADNVAHVKTPDGGMVPEASVEAPNPFDVGFDGDGKELPPGATFGSKLATMMGFKKTSTEESLQEGKAVDPAKVTVNPAKMSAEKMEKLIHDQLEESNSVNELSNAVFEGVMLGTGIVKGPFTYIKTLHKWDQDDRGKRTYKPIKTRVPRIEFVSVWDAYPDPNATCKEELSYFIHRHRFNASQLRGLGNMPMFDSKAILKCLEESPNYTKQSYENSIKSSEEEGTGAQQEDRYEVLEYWGVMGIDEAREVGLTMESNNDLAEIQINVWVCGNQILRIVSNPFTPTRIPYHIFNYEKNPYSLFGIGIPENMSDSQQMMNGHARMAVDNLALAGGLVFDVDETALVPGQDMEIYNGKVFYRQSGQPGQSVYAIKFPNTAQENLAMFDKFRQLADEETGIPSYSHGQTGVTGMTRTASGMSMLMGAASLTSKTVIKNLDNQLFKPLGDDFFQWNMQFFEGDLDIHGDLEVKALGTNSLMQKEVRSQRLLMFLQQASNPALAPYINIPYMIEELGISLELDKDRLLNTTAEARLAAEIIGLTNGQATGPQPSPPNQEQNSMGGPPGMGQGPGGPGSTGTGDGNIGTGIVPVPGEEEFSGQA